MLPDPPDAVVPGNPMMDASYLTSPLQTLVESLQDPRQDYISPHDIAEAYNSLTARIRLQAHTIIDAHHTLPALEKAKEYSLDLTRCLQRDLRCALVDPLHELRRTSTMESYPTIMMEHESEYARDLTLLCHHTLCFVSVLFALPPLFTILPSKDIDLLFDDVLMLASSRHLPTPEAHKTLTLATWIIQGQQLPSTILASKKSQIVAILRDLCSTSRIKQWTLDALKAIHNLLKTHGSIFISALPELLPSVLDHLISESAHCRVEAAYALSGAALATMRTDPHNKVIEISADIVHSFADAHTSTRNPAFDTARLSYLIRQALSSTNSVHEGPSWALVILASFTILSGARLFSHQRLFRLVLFNLSHTMTHGSEDVRAFHPQVWRALIWAFSCMSIEVDDQCTEKGGAGQDTTRARAFRVIRQGVGAGIDIAIVATLLGPTPTCDRGSADLPKALDIIRDMAGQQATSSNAVALLVRLLSNVPPTPITSHDVNIVSLLLFDGSVLRATCSPRNLFDEAATMEPGHVRPLSESEISEHWDGLLDLWVLIVQNLLRDTASLPPGELFGVWQTLLLARTGSTQGNLHLTTGATITDCIASTIPQFVVETQSVSEQICQLRLVKQLWGITRNVLSVPSLSPIANPLLTALLKRRFAVVDNSIREAWSQLGAELYTICDSSSVYAGYISKKHGELEVKRRLWMVIARSFEDGPDGARWEDMVDFLTMPFGRWAMSDPEFEIWESTLRNSFEAAGQESFRPTHVIERFLESLGPDPATLLTASPKVLTTILSYIHIDDENPHKVFSIIDDVLCALYPPLPEMLSTSLEIHRLLGETIVTAGSLLIVPLLMTMQKSLSIWIRDESNALLDNEYNTLLSYAYCNFLDVLRHEAPSPLILRGLSRFLTSSFSHIPPPALGPAAFERYWRATFHGLTQFSTLYTPKIKDCLKGLDTFKEGSLAAGLSFETETQISTISVIPDSQPSFHAPEASSIYEGDASHFNSEMSDSRLTAQPSLLPPIFITPLEHSSPPRRQPSIQLPLSPVNRQVSVTNFASRATKVPAQPLEHSTRPDKTTRLAGITEPPAHESRRQVTGSKRRHRTPESSAAPSNNKQPPSPSETAWRAQKRRRVDSISGTAAGNSRREPSTQPKTRPASRSSSEPLPLICAARTAPHASSLPPPATNTRRFFDGVEVPSVQDIMRRPPRRPAQQDYMAMRCDEGPSTPGGTSAPRVSSSPDYESWEAGVLSDDLRQVQRELLQGSDHGVPESDLGNSSDTEMHSARNASEDSLAPQSPSLDAWARRYGRSQTVPNLAPARANQRRHNRTTAAARLDALQRAYAAVAEGESQVEVQDLAQATSLVHQIGAVLSEQLRRKLGEDGR